MPYRLPEDEQARRDKNYYRTKRPDLDPQSTTSRILEFFGLDEPYRDDAGSYDYRQQAYGETGEPSWSSPLNDEDTEAVFGGVERTLGNLAPLAQNLDTAGTWIGNQARRGYNAVGEQLAPGRFDPVEEKPLPPVSFDPVQRPSTDERILSQLSPQDRAAVERMNPDEADKLLMQALGGEWSPKMSPIPSSWMGKEEREGDPERGRFAHAADAWNWAAPTFLYPTEDLLAAFTSSSPGSIRRDIAAYKGGSSYLDRAVGADEEPTTQNPYVDPVEIGAAATWLGVPALIANTSRAVVKGSKKAASMGRRVVQKLGKDRSAPKDNLRATITKAIVDQSRRKVGR